VKLNALGVVSVAGVMMLPEEEVEPPPPPHDDRMKINKK
tara:strand:- start:318 stop:434 length:117 start_codon:yes stop_codon:yes gene_type:complete